jgi:hypothetical protein
MGTGRFLEGVISSSSLRFKLTIPTKNTVKITNFFILFPLFQSFQIAPSSHPAQKRKEDKWIGFRDDGDFKVNPSFRRRAKFMPERKSQKKSIFSLLKEKKLAGFCLFFIISDKDLAFLNLERMF